ncbi:hypothetical protein MRX96_018072 [Rhipicephalus microplus]
MHFAQDEQLEAALPLLKSVPADKFMVTACAWKLILRRVLYMMDACKGGPIIRPGDSTTANTPSKGPIYSVVRRSTVVASRMIKDSGRCRLLRLVTRAPKTCSWPPHSLSNTSGGTTCGFRMGHVGNSSD